MICSTEDVGDLTRCVQYHEEVTIFVCVSHKTYKCICVDVSQGLSGSFHILDNRVKYFNLDYLTLTEPTKDQRMILQGSL